MLAYARGASLNSAMQQVEMKCLEILNRLPPKKLGRNQDELHQAASRARDVMQVNKLQIGVPY